MKRIHIWLPHFDHFLRSLIILSLFLCFFSHRDRSSECHLVAVDHVKCSVPVSDGLRSATAARQVGPDAGRRAGRVGRAPAFRIHEKRGGRLRDDFAGVAPAACLKLKRTKSK